MRDRGMMKWAPYKSLIEQEDFIKNMKKSKQKIEKPMICKEKEEEINGLLTHYEGQVVILSYYYGCVVEKIEGVIKYISGEFKCLYMDGKRYEFSNIVGLEIK